MAGNISQRAGIGVPTTLLSLPFVLLYLAAITEDYNGLR
jgi:hypothetical protein